MAKHANRSGSRDSVDSGRVGRMGGRRRCERSVSGEIARRLGRGFWRSKTRADGTHRGGSRGRGTMPFGSNPRSQRVTVKMLSRFHSRRSGSGLARHTGYLARDSAWRDVARSDPAFESDLFENLAQLFGYDFVASRVTDEDVFCHG